MNKKALYDPTVHTGTLLFLGALYPALFYKGPQFEYFAVAQSLLILWLMRVVLQSYAKGFQVPVTALTVSLTLFWVWLGVTLLWSPVPSTSVVNFWWVGSLPLVFWLYTLAPDRDAVWRGASAVVLLVGAVLALLAIYQSFVFDAQSRSVFETRNTHAAFLNLIVLPAAGYFLLAVSDRKASPRFIVPLGAILYILFYSIFLTAGRGALIALLLGFAVLLVIAARSVTRRSIVALAALVAAAFLSTQVTHGELVTRLPVLLHDPSRFVIWDSSWEMVKGSPWLGIGLGLYYLAYPAFRNPVDSAGGFFAHNDYLQIWVETGLPGLLFLVAALVSVLWLLVRLLRKPRLAPVVRVEAAGLFAGLLAIASHSFVDFNFYILSILMVGGLALGRFHDLAVRELRPRIVPLRPAALIGARAYPVVAVLLVAFPLPYFVALGISNSFYEKAMAQARSGEIEAAARGLGTAERLTPFDDRVLIAHADLFRHAIPLLPASDGERRRLLYEEAHRLLDRAEQVNPLRALTHVVRARLYREHPDYAGADWATLTATALEKGLALHPLMYRARTDYAELLLQQGRREQALRTLEQGVAYTYHESPEMLPFYKLTMRLRREAGRIREAEALAARIEPLERQAQAQYNLRGQ